MIFIAYLMTFMLAGLGLRLGFKADLHTENVARRANVYTVY